MTYYSNKQIFHLDTKNRASGTHTNFSYLLPNYDNSIEWTHVSLLDISIPKSFYIVQSNYNTFTLTENMTDATISIAAGNYTRTSLKNVLETALNAGSPNGWTYSISYKNIAVSEDDGKLTFSVSGNSSNQPSFSFVGSYLYEIMGFDEDVYTFSSDQLRSANIINLNKEGTLFLRSSICNDKGSNILQNIDTVDNPNYSYIVFVNPNPSEYSKPFVRSKTNNYDFVLTSEDANFILDLNGLNIIFTLMLWKEDSTNYLIREYIKYKAFVTEVEDKRKKELIN